MKSKSSAHFQQLLDSLEDGEEDGAVPAFVETPKGSHNKYKYEPRLGLFVLSGILPAGAVFPYDFGFIPYTVAPDGDPLDVLIFMDEPAFHGCLLAVRLVGVLEARQTEDGETIRNDRLVGVAMASHTHAHTRTYRDVERRLLKQIEAFFVDYNEQKGRKFKPLGWFGPKRAWRLLEQSRRDFDKRPWPPMPSPSPVVEPKPGREAKPQAKDKRQKKR